ncbi:Ger(x)C family spore germination protein [Candidatus Contubernalis alkalaceticus]|nr:Ger(x)C family spore germination protein [Candidatus Contubernalis alkalaceticus]
MISAIFSSGCWSSKEIDTLAITVAVGIDKSKDGYLLTMQFLNPRAIASDNPNISPFTNYSEEGKDLNEIMRRLSTKTGRKIYNSHLRIVVINEDIAKEGIKDLLDFFARHHEFRTDFYFVVARGTTAREVLCILPPLELVSGIKLHDSLDISEKEWAPTKSVRIIELVNDIIADGINPVLTGVEISDEEISTNMMPTKTLESLGASELANRAQYVGLGAFKEDKLVGWLNEDESKGYNYIIGNVKRTVGYVNYGEKVKVTSQVMKAKSVKKAFFIDGGPAVEVAISLEADIEAIEGDFDILKEENKKIIEELIAEKIKLMCENIVKKAQKEFKTDIFGFGEVIRREYPKFWREIKDDWNSEFVELPVSIAVETKIKQLGQITESLFVKGQD